MSDIANTIDFLWEAPDDEPPDLRIDPFFEDLLDLLDLKGVEISVLVTTDARIHELNLQYRQMDKPTDVLSFPNQQITLPPGEPRHLGDIVISQETADRQALEIGHSPDREIRFLCLHGVLHLLGYDHETDNGEMLALQSDLKSRLVRFF